MEDWVADCFLSPMLAGSFAMLQLLGLEPGDVCRQLGIIVT